MYSGFVDFITHYHPSQYTLARPQYKIGSYSTESLEHLVENTEQKIAKTLQETNKLNNHITTFCISRQCNANAKQSYMVFCPFVMPTDLFLLKNNIFTTLFCWKWKQGLLNIYTSHCLHCDKSWFIVPWFSQQLCSVDNSKLSYTS